jgi:hypothetical protein
MGLAISISNGFEGTRHCHGLPRHHRGVLTLRPVNSRHAVQLDVLKLGSSDREAKTCKSIPPRQRDNAVAGSAERDKLRHGAAVAPVTPPKATLTSAPQERAAARDMRLMAEKMPVADSVVQLLQAAFALRLARKQSPS